ncbi:MAG: hypothetical protein B6I30_10390, partial [Desulfobacteraceae bacterium 4572_187]
MNSVSFIKDGLIYWVGRMGARSVSFLLLPIYTAYIVPADWGVLNLLMISGDLAVLLVLCRIPSALFRFWVFAETNIDKQRIVGLGISFTVLFSITIFLPLFVWADFFTKLIGIEKYGNYLRVLLLAEFLSVLLSVIQAEMRLRDEAKLYALIDTGQNFGSAALNIFFVVILKLGIFGMLIGQAIAFAILAALLLPRFFRRIKINLDFKLLKRILAFSLPLVPSALAMAAIHNVDRYFIQFMLGIEQVGIYSIGYKFGTIVSILVLGPFILIWEPKSYEFAKSEGASNKFGQIFTYLTALLLFIAVGLTGASNEIVSVMTNARYHDASQIISLVAFSYVLFGMDSIVRVGLLVNHRTKSIMLIVLFAFFVNLAGNFLLIPWLGMTGAAWATLVTFVTIFFLDAYFSHVYLPILWEKKNLTAIAAASLIVTAGMLSIHGVSVTKAIVLKA